MSGAAGSLIAVVETLARKAVADAIRPAAGHAEDRVVEAWYSQRPRSQAEVVAMYDSAIARLSGARRPRVVPRPRARKSGR